MKTRSDDRKAGQGANKIPFRVIIALLLALAVLVFFLLLYGEHRPSMGSGADNREATLYFTSADGLRLTPIKTSLTAKDRQGAVKEVVEALIKGPEPNGPLSIALPRGTLLRGVRVEGETAFVDFSIQIVDNHWGGSNAELLTIYAVVNSITANFPMIKKVQILVEGKRLTTLAGHIAIIDPLGPDADMIEGQAPLE